MRGFYLNMKRILTILFLFGALSVAAQTIPEKAQLTVKYQFSVVQDSNLRSNVFKENMILLVGQKASLYKSYDVLLSDSTFAVEGLAAISKMQFRGRINDELLHYYDTTHHDLISKLLISKVYYEWKLPIFDWKITNDTASILGYQCKRATAFSSQHKKQFSAWFTADLPFSAGPNSFYGLPGLILKIESEDKLYSCIAYAISKPTILTQTIAINKEAQRSTYEDYKKTESAVKKNPDLLLQGLRGSFKIIK